MNERRLQRLLHTAPIRGEALAKERTWAVVRDAFAGRERISWPRRHARPLLAAAAVAALGAAIASPPGTAVLNSIRDAVGREKVAGVKRAAPALISLPAPGRLLVTATNGPWIIQRNGTKRRLGAYTSGGWSPHGLFIVATRGRELVAVDPKGNIRWTLTRRQPVRLARWSPDGYRIAYLAGSALHVVAGDSTGDHAIADAVAAVAPAWRPAAAHVLSFSDRGGRISTYAVDQVRLLWRVHPPQQPRALLWSPDGRYLLSIGRSSLTLYHPDGMPAGEILGPGAASVVIAAFSPDSQAIAFVQHSPRGSTLWLTRSLHPDATAARRLFAGGGNFSGLAWSPDGRWLLLGWESADQWLFIRAAGQQKLLAVSNITRQFSPDASHPARFPTLNGWCCTTTGNAG